jgi:hypothetical protein
MLSTPDTFEMSGPLTHLKPPDPTASHDERLDFIDVQLDSFGKDAILTIYECLGASERRRGGSLLHRLVLLGLCLRELCCLSRMHAFNSQNLPSYARRPIA